MESNESDREKVPAVLWDKARGYLKFYYDCSTNENQKRLRDLMMMPERRVRLLINGGAVATVGNYILIKKMIKALRDLEAEEFWNQIYVRYAESKA